MSVNWIDVSTLSFNTLLLLERMQIAKFPGWVPEEEIAIALSANPVIEWYLRYKCPEIIHWLDRIQSIPATEMPLSQEIIRQAEMKIMRTINDLIVYVVDPGIYDAQPFLDWDSDELRMLTDFRGKTVLDIGSGTGRLAFTAAEAAALVFAVEPVENLRHYIKQKASLQDVTNLFTVDGTITDIPFPEHFADVTMGGHVYGDNPEEEYAEMERVTKIGGMIILCPGTSQSEIKAHEYLLSQSFSWSEFQEPPGDGLLRKYWKTIE